MLGEAALHLQVDLHGVALDEPPRAGVVAALEGFSREAYGGAPVVATAFAAMRNGDCPPSAANGGVSVEAIKAAAVAKAKAKGIGKGRGKAKADNSDAKSGVSGTRSDAGSTESSAQGSSKGGRKQP